MRLFFQERTGSSRVIRAAIAKHVDALWDRLEKGLEQRIKRSGIRMARPRLFTRAMMRLVFAAVMEMLVRPDTEESELVRESLQQIHLLWMGSIARQESVAMKGEIR